MRKVVGELVFDGMGRRVVQRVFKNGAWDARVPVVERNEWIPADECYVERDGRLGEPDLSERVFTAKIAS
jgi:hypothetical protein